MGAWRRDAVIYQVRVHSFADGNGDGVGDLIGVRDRLPYLLRRGFHGDLVWHDSPPGTLVFARGDLLCTVNLTGSAVDFAVDGEPLLASDVPGTPDSATWW
jgi:alpha-glucosidase